jgi:hypothetical protein
LYGPSYVNRFYSGVKNSTIQ